MRVFIDPHAEKRANERSTDISMFLSDEITGELKKLPMGKKLVKRIKGTTIVFKKTNRTQTVFMKTVWGKRAINNIDYNPAPTPA
ncbi:hypothetical protein ACXWTF_12870 [Thiomicrolovo sp. ZZH C-3]